MTWRCAAGTKSIASGLNRQWLLSHRIPFGLHGSGPPFLRGPFLHDPVRFLLRGEDRVIHVGSVSFGRLAPIGAADEVRDQAEK